MAEGEDPPAGGIAKGAGGAGGGGGVADVGSPSPVDDRCSRPHPGQTDRPSGSSAPHPAHVLATAASPSVERPGP